MAGQRSRVRLNFVNTKENSSWYGQTNKKDSPVLDAKTYQVAWEKIDEAIFVRSGTTAVAPKFEARAIAVGDTSGPAAATTGGPTKRKAKTASGFCYDVPEGYVGLGSVDKPALTTATPACYQLLQQ
jgi:hypothetical protein